MAKKLPDPDPKTTHANLARSDLLSAAKRSIAMPQVQCAMRLIALIEEPLVIEKTLRHLNLGCGPKKFAEARSPHGDPVFNPQSTDDQFLIEEQIMPDYEKVITD